MSREEVLARLGKEECDVKTLDNTHLYCEPPEEQPLALDDDDLPKLTVSLNPVTSVVVSVHMFCFLNVTKRLILFWCNRQIQFGCCSFSQTNIVLTNMTSFEHHSFYIRTESEMRHEVIKSEPIRTCDVWQRHFLADLFLLVFSNRELEILTFWFILDIQLCMLISSIIRLPLLFI